MIIDVRKKKTLIILLLLMFFIIYFNTHGFNFGGGTSGGSGASWAW